MTFPRVNPLGWALFELLTSAQMNQMDIDHINAMDGLNGGDYVFQAGANGTGNITWDFRNVPDDGSDDSSFKIILGAETNGVFITGDFTGTNLGAGLVVDIDSLAGLSDNQPRPGILALAYGDRATGVDATGGSVSGATGAFEGGGEGGKFLGGRNTGGSAGGNGGVGIEATGGESTSSDLTSESGAGGVFIGARTLITGRNAGHGVDGTGGDTQGATAAAAGGNFLGGDSQSGISGSGIIAVGGSADIAGVGATIMGGVAALAAAARGAFVVGGDTSTGATGGDGIVAVGGVGSARGGVGLVAQAGDVAGGDSAAIVANSREAGDALQVFMQDSLVVGGSGLYIQNVQNKAEAIRVETLDVNPDSPTMHLQPTAEPLNAGVEGDIYYDLPTGRLAFFNGEAGETASVPAYETIATASDAPIYRAAFSSLLASSTVTTNGSRILRPATVSIGGTGNVELIVDWTVDLPSGDYVALAQNTGDLGAAVLNRYWSVLHTFTTETVFSLFEANGAAVDLTAELWSMNIVIYGPGDGTA